MISADNFVSNLPTTMRYSYWWYHTSWTTIIFLMI